MPIQEFIFAKRPVGLPDASVFQKRTVELPELNDGALHVKGLYYSVDPYMRGRMNEGRSYVPGFEIGKPFQGGVVARVVASRAEGFREGDLVSGMMPWATEAIVPAKGLQKIVAHTDHASLYLGLLGITGLTAYFGLMDIGKPVAGETVVVSGAAGAVGTAVGQIAKIKGCRVVGIAGSDYKASMLRETFGFDDVVNYKKDLVAGLKAACPKGVDVYFENVGGEVGDAVLQLVNDFGRIPLCGLISSYNDTAAATGMQPQGLLLTRRLLMKGFIVSDYAARWGEGVEVLSKWYEQGLLKPLETVVEGFDQLPTALLGLFAGKNTGKMVVKA